MCPYLNNKYFGIFLKNNYLQFLPGGTTYVSRKRQISFTDRKPA